MNGLRNMLLLPLRFFYDNIFGPTYKNRVAYYIAQNLPYKGLVLDVGCNDGTMAQTIRKFRPHLSFVGIDIQANRPAKIPRKLYDGKHFPFKDEKFDAVIAVDVLHHTRDIPGLLEEMNRVTKKLVVIKDHYANNRWEHLIISVVDFMANSAFGIRCAYNFPSISKWDEYFRGAHLRQISRLKKMQLGFFLTEKNNPIFVLNKHKY